VLPWLIGCSDLLENTGIITMACSYPSQRRLLAQLTSVATRLKRGMLIPMLLLWLAGGAVWLLERVGDPTSKAPHRRAGLRTGARTARRT
jgi:hypothetical protein